MPLPRVLTGLLFALPAALAAPGVAHTEMLASKTFSYFTIGGKTAAELDEQLSSHGPLMKGTGSRHPGATKIKFGGTVTYVEKNGRCHVGEAKVTLNTRIILPKWKHRRSANRDLALIWDTLSSDIKRHEERHAEIARQHARRMERRLMKLRPEADCERMQARVGRESLEAIAEHDKDQARFDRAEAVNFDRRIMRLLEYRLKTREENKS